MAYPPAVDCSPPAGRGLLLGPVGDHSNGVHLKIFRSLASVPCLCAGVYRALPWERALQFVTLFVFLVFVLLWECAPWLWCVDAV